jgi:hypothetical protein
MSIFSRCSEATSCPQSQAYVSIRQYTSSYVIIRQHPSAYVSIRQHTSAYASIRQHTSAYADNQVALIEDEEERSSTPTQHACVDTAAPVLSHALPVFFLA